MLRDSLWQLESFQSIFTLLGVRFLKDTETFLQFRRELRDFLRELGTEKTGAENGGGAWAKMDGWPYGHWKREDTGLSHLIEMALRAIMASNLRVMA